MLPGQDLSLDSSLYRTYMSLDMSSRWSQIYDGGYADRLK